MKQWLVAAALFAPGIALAAININTATKDDLVALPGIGPAKAQAIVDHRKAHGPFKTVEDLKDVKGIGAKRFEKMRPDLAVSGPNTGVKLAAKGDGGRRGAAAPAPAAAPARRDAPAKP
jgi:competence protein ComEA